MPREFGYHSGFVSRGPKLCALLIAGGHEQQLPTAAIVHAVQWARWMLCTGISRIEDVL